MGIFPFESKDSDSSHDSLLQRVANIIREKKGYMVWTAGLLTFLLMPALALGTDFRNLEQSQTYVEDSQQNHTEPMTGTVDTAEDIKPVDTAPSSSQTGDYTRDADAWTNGGTESKNSSKSKNSPTSTRAPAEANTNTTGSVKPSVPAEANRGLNLKAPVN